MENAAMRQERYAVRKQQRADAIAKATTAAEAARLKREQALEDMQSKREFDTQMAILKSELGIERDPLQRRLIEAKINKLGAETTKLGRELDGTGDGMTEYQRLQLEETRKRNLLAERANDLKLDERTKDELANTAEIFVNDDGEEIELSFEERKANALQANNRSNNPIYYQIIDPVETPWLDFALDEDGQVHPVYLPRHPVTGKQITSQDVIDTIRANPGMTEEDVLTAIGAM